MVVTTISPEMLAQTLNEVEIVIVPRSDYEALLKRSRSRAQFTVIMERDEESGYTVVCPALPGCVSEGETRAEALDNIREAITGYLEAADMQAQMAPEGIQVEKVLV